MSQCLTKSKPQIPHGLTARMALAYNAGYRVQIGPGPDFLCRDDLVERNSHTIKAIATSWSRKQ